MKLIGKGLFTKAYLKDKNTVILKSVDPIKECMSMGWFPDSNLFPKIERLDYDDNGVATYEMKYYPRVTSLKTSLCPSHYEIYKELRSLNIETSQNKHDGLNNVHKAFKTIKNKRVKTALLEAVDACGNYGSCVSFEISPRNVAVSKTGKLILLDCFFMQDAAERQRTNQ